MYDGFYREWAVNIIAFGLMTWGVGAGWGWIIGIAFGLGFLAAASLVLLPALRVPVNLITVTLLLIVVNTALVYLVTNVFRIGDALSSFTDALLGGVGVSVIRGLVREAFDRLVPPELTE
jgi:uncharacterized membrane protein YvlD (DUF360 family)